MNHNNIQMTTYYYTPVMDLENIIQKLKIGDNVKGLPYLQFSPFVKLLKSMYRHADYLYEGKNFIVFSLV